MISKSSAFHTAASAYGRSWDIVVTVTNGVATETYNGAEVTISEKFAGNALVVGRAFAQQAKIKIYEPDRGLDYAKSTYTISAGLMVSGSFDYVPMGTFYGSTVQDGEQYITVTAYDALARTNENYTPHVTAPTTVGAVVADICSQYNISTSITSSTTISELYEGTAFDTLGYLAGLTGCNAVMGRDNKLVFRTYGASGTSAIKNKTPSLTVTRKFEKEGGVSLEGTFYINSVTSGTSDNVMVSGTGKGITFEDPYITQTQVNTVGTMFKQLEYYTGKITWFGDPCVEIGDILYVKDKNNTSRKFLVSEQEILLAGSCSMQTTSCGVADAEINFSTDSPTDKKLKQVKSSIQKMKEDFTNKLNTATGGIFIVEDRNGDGLNDGFYIADSTDPSNQHKFIRANYQGIGFSKDGGITYDTAISSDGIIADAIYTGLLTDGQTDGAGHLLNYWNFDEKEVSFNVNKLSIRGTDAATVTDVNGAKQYTDQVVNALTIGATNLWIQTALNFSNYTRGSTTTAGWYYPTSSLKSYIQTETVDNTQSLVFAGNNQYAASQYFKVEANTTYTISCEAYIETARSGAKLYWYSTANPMGELSTSKNTFSCQWTPTTSGFIRGLIYTSNSSDTLHVQKIKVEKGNVATAWSPAPSDTDGYIDDLRADLETQIDNKIATYYSATAPTNPDTGDIWYCSATTAQDATHANKTWRWSGNSWKEITAVPDSLYNTLNTKKQVFRQSSRPTSGMEDKDLWINTTNDQMYSYNQSTQQWELIMDYKAYADNASTDVLASSKEYSEQLINALSTDNYNKWIETGYGFSTYTVGSSSKVGWYNNPKSRIVSEDGSEALVFSGSSSYNCSQYMEREATKYTVSCEAKLTTTRDGAKLYFYAPSSQHEMEGDALSTTWQKFKVTFNNTNAGIGRTYFYTNNSSDEVHIRKIKVEKGDRATSWSPSPYDTNTYIDDLRTDLETQVDSKIETFYQPAEPTSKDTGDIWYCTSTSGNYAKRTWRWSGSSWQEINAVPNSLYDTVDHKKTVYYGTTSPSGASENDLWVDTSGSSSTLMVRRGSTWVNASDYKTYVDSENTEKVWKKLTNNGQQKCIEYEGNTLYINADYIGSGTLSSIMLKSDPTATSDSYRNFVLNLNTGDLTMKKANINMGSAQGNHFYLNTSDTSSGYIEWKAANSSMTKNGTLTCSNITVTGGSLAVTGSNYNFKVTSSGQLSWKSENSSMTSTGKLTCTGASINGTITNESTKEQIKIYNGNVHFAYRTGSSASWQDAGYMGTLPLSGTTKPTLSMVMDNDAEAVGWFKEPTSGTTNTLLMAYYKSDNRITTGVILDLNGNDLQNANLHKSCNVKPQSIDTGKSWTTASFKLPTGINSTTGAVTSWQNVNLIFTHGVLTGGNVQGTPLT